MLIQFGLGDSTTVDEIQNLYYTIRNESMVVFQDVEESLIELRQRGLRLIAASNGDLSRVSVGLDSYFDGTHYAGAVGISKPDPAFSPARSKNLAVRLRRLLPLGTVSIMTMRLRLRLVCTRYSSIGPVVLRTLRLFG